MSIHPRHHPQPGGAIGAARRGADRSLAEIRALCAGSREAVATEPGRALAMAQRAVTLAHEASSDADLADALRCAGVAHYFLGEHREAANEFSRALTLARVTGLVAVETSCLNGLAAAFHALGDLEGSLECLEQVLALARSAGDVDGEDAALINIGNLHQDLLNFEHAAHVYGEVLQRAKLNADFRATALNNRANAYRALGQFDRSLEGHHAALSLVRDQGLPLREPMILGNIARCRLEAGDAAGALATAQQALDLAQARDLTRDRFHVLMVLGEAACALGQRSDALARFREAADCARESGNFRDEREALRYGLDLQFSELPDGEPKSWWSRVRVLDEDLRTTQISGRAQALAIRLQLQQARHELEHASTRVRQMGTRNDRLRRVNRSLKQAMRAFGIDADRPRAKPGRGDAALTPRELQVLRLVAQGMTNERVGQTLGLTRLTVRHYVSCILRKLGATSRTQAVSVAMRDGLA